MRFFVYPKSLLSCVFLVSLLGISAALGADQPDTASARAASSYGDLPLSFEANQGQTGGQVRFLSRGDGYTFFLTPSEAVFAFSKSASSSGATLRMRLAGAGKDVQINGIDPLPGKSNYFSGSNPSQWRTGVPTYRKVAYQNIYPGINLVYYGNQHQMEYDFVVAPGADPRAIRLAVTGAQRLTVDAEGNLVLHTASGDVRLLAPKIYQNNRDGEKQEIAGQWQLHGKNSAGFRLAAYNHSQALVIDPVLMYSSFLGGSEKNSLKKIAIDAAGNAYVAGFTASGDFPAAPTPLASTFGGGPTSRGAFIAKIDPTGANLLYSTYLSGSVDEEATGLAVDASGNVYVTGTTHSTDFPVRNALQSSCTVSAKGACSNAFLTKISPTGDSLLYSTYLGGTGVDSAKSLAVDAKGNTYVVGATSSLDFPVTAGALQAKCGGACAQNAFVAKFDTKGESLVYATYLGGSGSDAAADIAIDAAGNAYVAGQTSSADFPVRSAFQKSCMLDATSSAGACLSTAFVAKVKADGSALSYSTYLGGSLGSTASGIAVDAQGAAYVTGSTQSADFPVLKAFQKSCGIDAATSQCSVDAFLTKFAPSGKALVYSTYLGGAGRDEASGIAVDAKDNVHLVGRTESKDFPTANAAQAKLSGTSDAFVAQFSATGSSLNFSTFHGGSSTETGNGLALDAKGNVYLTGETASSDFPTYHPFQSSCAGACASAFVSKMSLPPGTPPPTITSAASATFTVGSAGTFTVTTSGTPTATLDDGGATLPTGVSFTDNGDGTGTLTGTPAAGQGDIYPITFTATNTGGPATQAFTLTVNETPSIRSANNTTFTVGTAGSFTITTRGFPFPALTETGALPSPVTFTDNGDGTATLAGTPAASTGGTYPLSIKATNTLNNVTQSFTLTVTEAPTITSADNTTFTVGTAGTFTVTATGSPAPTLSETGALPTGVNFNTTTGVLAGTPAAGTGGIYPITFKATSSSGTATQSFTLTVNQAPSITSANNAAFLIGVNGTFTVTTKGIPVPTLAETGALPANVTFTDNGDGTATITGIPAAGTSGTYPISIRATNSLNTATQSFSLTVTQPPAITSGNSVTFAVGTAGTFTVTTTGFPIPTLSDNGATLPGGVSFTDNGNGTGTLAGTPALGSGGIYNFNFKATNSAGSDTQAFTLTVSEGPGITSANNTTFTVGALGSFTVTTRGLPRPTLSDNGATLPGGVSFTDNGNGTGTLTGTPAAAAGGIYPITFTAHNGIGADANQNFSLTVNQAPAITSGNTLNCQIQVFCTFTVTTTGFPAASISETGTLPSGLHLTSNGDGTGTISGTPSLGSGGVYTITVKGTNVAGTATQTFTITFAEYSFALSSTSPTSATAIQGGAAAPLPDVLVTSQNGYTGTIVLSCPAGGLPTGAACAFGNNNIPLTGGTSADSTVMIATATNMPVGAYNVTFNSTDGAGDTHNITFPFLVECTYSLTNPVFSPKTVTTDASYSITVTETAGGSVCPWTAATSGTGVSITAGTGGTDTAANTGLPITFTVAAPATTVKTGTITASYFAATSNHIGTSPLTVTQEVSAVAPDAIAGGSTTANVAVSQSGAGAASISFTSPCGAVDGTGVPNTGITCSAPTTALPATDPIPVTINISATASLQPGPMRKFFGPLYALGFALPGIVFLGLGATMFGSSNRRRRGLLRFLSPLLVVCLIALLAGCGGGFNALVVQKGSANDFIVTMVGTVSDGSGQTTGIEVYTVAVHVTPQI